MAEFLKGSVFWLGSKQNVAALILLPDYPRHPLQDKATTGRTQNVDTRAWHRCEEQNIRGSSSPTIPET